eukprot:1364849-Prymnesium_polylepis.1
MTSATLFWQVPPLIWQVTLYIDRIGGTEGEVTVEYTTKEQTATADADYVSAKVAPPVPPPPFRPVSTVTIAP